MKKFKNLKIIKRKNSTKISTRFTKNSTLCTLSGGQDSILTFFLLLHSQSPEFLYILYCHHFWQFKNFFSARLLFQLSYLVNVSYIVILPQKYFLNENESRNWRKKNFCRVSQLENTVTNLTGHTQTDNLEKKLQNLLRGTSPAGLSGWNLVTSQNRTEIFFSKLNLNNCFFYKFKKLKNIATFSPSRIPLEFVTIPLAPVPNLRNLGSTVLPQIPKEFGKGKVLQKIGLKSKFSARPVDEFRNHFLFEKRKRKNSFGPVLSSNLTCKIGTQNGKEKFTKIPSSFLKKNKLKQNFRLINQEALFSDKMSEAVERKNFYYIKGKKPFLNELYFLSVTSVEKKYVQIPRRTKALFLSKATSTFLVNKRFRNCENLKTTFFEVDSRKSYSFCLSIKFWNTNVKLLRPLQYLNRVEVSKILKLYKLPNLIDMTNFSSIFSRNKIRHQFIPFIRFLFHRKVDSLLINFFQMLEEDYIDREKQIQELYFLCNLVNSKSRKNTIFSLQLIPILKKVGLDSFFFRIFSEADFLFFESLKPSSLCPESPIKPKLNLSFKQKFVQGNYALLKTLIKSISEPLTKSVNKKLFIDYKNLTLNYSQTLKLREFY